MIESLNLIKFQGVAKCYSAFRYSQEGFVPITYTFKSGNVYGLISDFGCGSWGLATCLGGRCDEVFTGEIYVNEQKTSFNSLRKFSAFIGEWDFDFINSNENLSTAKEYIQKALSESGIPYSLDEIISAFHLSNVRLNRPLIYTSGEIWLISLAINFSLGKEIFCYPWLSSNEIGRFKTAIELNIFDFLKKNGKIILIPSSQKKVLKKYCDHTICFGQTKMLYR